MKKVAIAGAEPLTRDNVPFGDTSYEIWGLADWLNSAWLKRCDALFEIHSASVYMNHPRTPGYWEALQKAQMPVYMYPIADPRVSNSVLYPLEGILDMIKVGKNNGKPFRMLDCSTVYALALAIFYEYDVIDIYGVELAHSSEYMSQQTSFAFWNGVAVARGIEVNVNCSDKMFHRPLYGLEDIAEKNKMYQYMKVVKEQYNDAVKQEHMTQGALQMLHKLLYGDEHV